MESEIRVTPKFESDLESILNHISSKKKAKLVYQSLYSSIKDLQDFPLSGRSLPEDSGSLFNNYREKNLLNEFRLIYAVNEKEILLLRIISAKQNIIPTKPPED